MAGETDVQRLLAEGRSNQAILSRAVITELDLWPDGQNNRHAVLTYLRNCS